VLQHPFLCWQGENKSENMLTNNLQLDKLSQNIFIVEENKRPSDEEIKMIQKKMKSNRKKLHEYILPDSHEDLKVIIVIIFRFWTLTSQENTTFSTNCRSDTRLLSRMIGTE
jgi:hypothetical protein